jgi:hypothetical protein
MCFMCGLDGHGAFQTFPGGKLKGDAIEFIYSHARQLLEPGCFSYCSMTMSLNAQYISDP